MAKTSSVYRNLKRVKMAQKFNSRRQKLKDIVMDKNASPEESPPQSCAIGKKDRFEPQGNWLES